MHTVRVPTNPTALHRAIRILRLPQPEISVRLRRIGILGIVHRCVFSGRETWWTESSEALQGIPEGSAKSQLGNIVAHTMRLQLGRGLRRIQGEDVGQGAHQHGNQQEHEKELAKSDGAKRRPQLPGEKEEEQRSGEEVEGREES